MKLKLLIALLLPALLVGCTEKAPLPTEPAQRYTVRFLAGGQNISVQTLAEGSYPSPPRELPGYILAGWLDESGLPTAPEASPLEDDRSYTALVYPDLRGHRPYLFPDESGDLRPDAVLTAGELRLALEALAADPAALESISLPGEPSPTAFCGAPSTAASRNTAWRPPSASSPPELSPVPTLPG